MQNFTLAKAQRTQRSAECYERKHKIFRFFNLCALGAFAREQYSSYWLMVVILAMRVQTADVS